MADNGSEIQAVAQLGQKGIEVAEIVLSPFLGPMRTRRQAEADATASVMSALTEQVVSLIETDPTNPQLSFALASAGGRMRFKNLVRIIRLAAPQLSPSANPSDIDTDWVLNFTDKARNCADEEMAKLWGNILAGKANNPGSYSRKSVNILSDIEPEDARLFRNLSNFRLIPVDPIYEKNGIL